MPARKGTPPRPVAQVQVPGTDDNKTQRALDVLASAVQQLQATRGVTGGSVAGSRAGGDALENLLAVLAAQGIITDDTTA